jgi:hypothetical protein
MSETEHRKTFQEHSVARIAMNQQYQMSSHLFKNI